LARTSLRSLSDNSLSLEGEGKYLKAHLLTLPLPLERERSIGLSDSLVEAASENRSKLWKHVAQRSSS
jgi:hypothetical protein